MVTAKEKVSLEQGTLVRVHVCVCMCMCMCVRKGVVGSTVLTVQVGHTVSCGYPDPFKFTGYGK